MKSKCRLNVKGIRRFCVLVFVFAVIIVMNEHVGHDEQYEQDQKSDPQHLDGFRVIQFHLNNIPPLLSNSREMWMAKSEKKNRITVPAAVHVRANTMGTGASP